MFYEITFSLYMCSTVDISSSCRIMRHELYYYPPCLALTGESSRCIQANSWYDEQEAHRRFGDAIISPF